jgi:hypothetical protein
VGVRSGLMKSRSRWQSSFRNKVRQQSLGQSLGSREGVNSQNLTIRQRGSAVRTCDHGKAPTVSTPCQIKYVCHCRRCEQLPSVRCPIESEVARLLSTRFHCEIKFPVRTVDAAMVRVVRSRFGYPLAKLAPPSPSEECPLLQRRKVMCHEEQDEDDVANYRLTVGQTRT